MKAGTFCIAMSQMWFLGGAMTIETYAVWGCIAVGLAWVGAGRYLDHKGGAEDQV